MSDQSREAAGAFCAAQYPRLVGSMTLYVGDYTVAEELAQEALMRAFRRWEHVERLDSPAGWLWRVATNLANSHFRRRRAERRASERLRATAGTVVEDRDPAWGVAVRRAVSRLPERQRAALILATTSTTVTWQALDDQDPSVVTVNGGTNAHTFDHGWFMIADMDPAESGCWRVTASYRGAELSYVYFVDPSA